MSRPMVVAVMLVNGREAMVRRAIASFRAQTYGRKKLVVLDTTPNQLTLLDLRGDDVHLWHTHPRAGKPCDETIGALRNKANEFSLGADLICHFDSDDHSHPLRIEEQVALMQASGKECVGYREVLFWDTRFKDDGNPYCNREAWLLSLPDPRSMVGASMMYMVDAWRRHPFCDGPRPGADGKITDYEDNHWLMHNSSQTLGTSACWPFCEPRMVCAIHGDRQSGSYEPATMRKAKEWRRVPDWDLHCARAMKL